MLLYTYVILSGNVAEMYGKKIQHVECCNYELLAIYMFFCSVSYLSFSCKRFKGHCCGCSAYSKRVWMGLMCRFCRPLLRRVGTLLEFKLFYLHLMYDLFLSLSRFC